MPHLILKFFRNNVDRLTSLLVVEATRDVHISETSVETPLSKTTGHYLTHRIGLIPILRAGLGMVDSALHLLPNAEVWHLGLYRDEKTFKPVDYYNKLPHSHAVDSCMILDPMLATGGSAIAAVEALSTWGVHHIKVLSLIAAPEGITNLSNHFPDTQIYVCAIDEKLDENAFIVPGLGDAGDRIFNAKAT